MKFLSMNEFSLMVIRNCIKYRTIQNNKILHTLLRSDAKTLNTIESEVRISKKLSIVFIQFFKKYHKIHNEKRYFNVITSQSINKLRTSEASSVLINKQTFHFSH